MKKNSVGPGVFLIMLGILWLLYNFGVLNTSIFSAFMAVWPFIFIVIGVSFMFKDKPWVSVVMWILFIALVVVYALAVLKNAPAQDLFNNRHWLFNRRI